MRRIALSLAFSVLVLTPAMAALPPQYQRLAELMAILQDESVSSAFQVYQAIDKLEWISNDLYRVTSENCSMDVTIVDAPTPHEAGWVGAREFAVKAGTLVCN